MTNSMYYVAGYKGWLTIRQYAIVKYKPDVLFIPNNYAGDTVRNIFSPRAKENDFMLTRDFDDAISCVKKIVIAEGVQTLEVAAFMGFTGLEEVELPSTIYSIGKDCFVKCPNLVKINTEHVEYIHDGAF